MPNYRVTFDCSTGKEELVEITAEEQAEMDEQAAAEAIALEAAEAARAKEATDAAAGKAKLKELGLTDDQIAALVG
tara:strand:- start:275 stop:502 length:228 start_codon:yes stop_codon:yes gene_type:complete